jgi:hypothetical protein
VTTAAAQAQALSHLVDDVAALVRRGAKPVVVFDLDDTLFSTAQRNLRILREFASSRPGVPAALAGVRPEMLRYAIADSARAAGVDAPELLAELQAFWRARFFTNEYLLTDEPLPGAVGYCEELARAGATLVYMTGRDEGMREGTERSLRSRGFPLRGTALVLKPSFETPDLEFKTRALAALPSHGEVRGAFENEPAHVNLFRDAFPEALMYFVETRHSGKPVEPHPSARRIKDFLR